jgi:hypothetical protein
MSEILLMVSDALTHEQFQSCMVVPLHSSSQAMADLQQFGPIATKFVATTYSTDADSVRSMLEKLTTMGQTERRIVFADNAIPQDLRVTFPQPLTGLLQRILPCDLKCVSAAAAQQSTGSTTMIQSVFGGELQTEFIPGAASLARFPEAGAGNHNAACGVPAATLTSSIERALACLKIPSSERMCVTAGILLLWIF